MNKTFALDNFDLATATIAVIDNQILQTLELYLYDCNALFTELTELKPDKKNDVSEKAFGKKKQEYLSDLLKLSRTGLKEIFIFRIQTTKKWLYCRVFPGVSPLIHMLCFDFTTIQRQLNSFKLQNIGYQYYIENFHALGYQRLLKPEMKPVFTAGAYEEITGYTADQAKDFRSWLEIIHPDDKEKAEVVALEMYDKVGFQGELEYRIIKKDGEVRWMHSYDSNFLSEDGTMQMVQGLIVDVTRQKEQEIKLQQANDKIIEQNEKLEELSLTDHLTGLSNRRAVQQVLNYLIRDYKRTEESFSILMIDIDHFKKVNDKHGHDAGDVVLVGFSRILLDNLRQIDIKSRWGGEEFLILLPHTSRKEAKDIASKLLNKIRKAVLEYKKINIHITFSCGVANYDQAISLQTLIQNADKALYKAKEKGRNQIVPFK
ncbi:MAG: sensor domain-containing diguanylate cyclase [Spirochaetaceae bacterium]|jgi:diguanylate cyclase (GGDEF)-like protein/PAS domain S-box-containing protein|nr:sensor domain-containing diguanylate cyclase [Spirochaetaceae bacterium]